jgi:hypothetical protein
MPSRTWVQPSLPLEPRHARARAERLAPRPDWPQSTRLIMMLSLGLWAGLWKLGTLLF